MKWIKSPKSLPAERLQFSARTHIAIGIGNDKSAEHEEEINKKVAPQNERIVNQRGIGKPTHMKENNHRGKNAPENVQCFKTFLHRSEIVYGINALAPEIFHLFNPEDHLSVQVDGLSADFLLLRLVKV